MYSPSELHGKPGFSLVELSIVLVILGLLTGGILAGQSLIRASELRAVSTEYSKYISAVNSFRDKYFALPGDMRNAVKFWDRAAGGTADGVDSTCYNLTTASTDAKTCNGDGNGVISYGVYNGAEQFRFWQQLANAGLVEGTYSGVLGAAGQVVYAIPGTNVPRGKMSNSGWTVTDWASGGDAYWWNMGHTDYGSGNNIFFGGLATNAPTHAGLMSAEEVWNVDTKMDDGKPGRGKVRSQSWASDCTLAISSTDFGAEYALTQSAKSCSVVFPRAF